MAVKKLGNDYMLWLESTTPGTYNLIGGQGTVTVNRAAAKIDLTTKDDGGYGVSAPGIKDLTISLEIMPKLPDATGYTRLETLCNASPQAAFNIQIRKNGTSGVSADSVLTASVYGNLDSVSYEKNGGTPVKASFYLAAAPTVDTYA